MRIAKIAVIIVLACTALLARDRSLQELKDDVAKAKPGDQPKLYVDIAELELKQVDTLYGSGDAEKGQASLTELVTDCEKAAETSRSTRKHMKSTEIALRKIGARLETVRRNAAFDDRPPLQTAIDRVEQARTALLNAMFAK